MGICYLQHRIRTGTYSHIATTFSNTKYSFTSRTRLSGGWSQYLKPTVTTVCGIYYMFIILLILAMAVDLGLPHIIVGSGTSKPYPFGRGLTLSGLSLLSTTHIKIAYLVLIMRPILRMMREGPAKSMKGFSRREGVQTLQKTVRVRFLRDMKSREPRDRYFRTRDMSRDQMSTQ